MSASEKLAMGTLTSDAASSPATEAPMTLHVNLGAFQPISIGESKTQLKLGSKPNATELAVACGLQMLGHCGLQKTLGGHTSTSKRFFMNSCKTLGSCVKL